MIEQNNSHDLFFTAKHEKEFSEVLTEVQEYLSNKHASLVLGGNDNEAKRQIRFLIEKYLTDNRITAKDMSDGELIEKLEAEMLGYSILTKYIFGKGIEEININSWRDIEVYLSGGAKVKIPEHFESKQHALNIVRKMLHKSGMVLDNASPVVLGHLSKNIRISAMKYPVVDEDVGVSASIRIVNPQNFAKEDFVRFGTATEPMLEFLSQSLRYGVSTCAAGATGSGKTTVAGWILSTIPNEKRVITIESGSRELNLTKIVDDKVVNSVVHMLARPSENEKQNIDQDILLDYSLRFNPDIICVGEMRGPEAYTAQEASRTGHTVLTTIHSNSCESTYSRMVTLCKRKVDMLDKTLYDLVTEAFPLVVYCKQLENRERKIMEIMECELRRDGERVFRPIYRYNIKENRYADDKLIIRGEHEIVNEISDSLKRRLVDNGMPNDILEKIMEGEKKYADA